MRVYVLLVRILLIGSFAGPCLAVASEIKNIDTLISRAEALKLSQHPTWHKLIHYEKQFASKSQVSSAIHDQSFFNADEGKTSPSDELNATLRALLLPQTQGTQQHAQCRFPARRLWLESQLDLSGINLTPVNCPDFDNWSNSNTIESISIVYASGYLGNPATYYGHTLLKLNSVAERRKSKLLDQSVNYGVIVPDKEDPLTYIVKSLFGGYDGGFSQAYYHFHTHSYGEIELRDLWEYELNLSKEEVDFVVAHAWEVLNRRYTYYFFQENCAYRLAEILEIIDDVKIIPDNPIFTLPRTVLQKMATTSRSGKPIIREINYHPSRQSRLYEKFNTLTPAEKSIVSNASLNADYLKSDTYESLSLLSKQMVLDTLLDYYQFAQKAEALPDEKVINLYQNVLSMRFSLPPGTPALVKNETPAPHKGRKASQLRVGFIHNSDLGDGLSILLRPTYYDVLDADAGHVSDSALAMGEVKLFLKNNQLKIRHIDFFKLKSVNHGITGLPGDSGKSWKLKLGIEQQNLSRFDRLSLKFQGDYGLSLRPYSNVLIGAYIGGGIQDNRVNSGNLFAKASIFSHVKLTNKLLVQMLAEIPKQIDGSGGGENLFSLEARQKLTTNTDLRFLYEKNGASEYSLALGYYF